MGAALLRVHLDRARERDTSCWQRAKVKRSKEQESEHSRRSRRSSSSSLGQGGGVQGKARQGNATRLYMQGRRKAGRSSQQNCGVEGRATPHAHHGEQHTGCSNRSMESSNATGGVRCMASKIFYGDLYRRTSSVMEASIHDASTRCRWEGTSIYLPSTAKLYNPLSSPLSSVRPSIFLCSPSFYSSSSHTSKSTHPSRKFYDEFSCSAVVFKTYCCPE